MSLVTKKNIQDLIATRQYVSNRGNRDDRSAPNDRQSLSRPPLSGNYTSRPHISSAHRLAEEPYPPRETPENIEKVRAALGQLDPNSPRGNGKDQGTGIWLIVVWAVASLAWDSTKEILREWSQCSPKYDPEVFEKTYNSYDPTHSMPIRIGTLYKLAKKGNSVFKTDQNQLPQPNLGSINLSDVANGRQMASKFRETLMSVRDTPQWIRWDEGVGWKEAESEIPMQAAKAVLDDMRQCAAQAVLEGKEASAMIREITRTSKAPSMSAMIKLCESESGMTAGLAELDNDPLLLGVKNGVVDLKTMKLIAPDPSVLVVKRANVIFDPRADAPRFRTFLEEIIPDAELRAFLVRVLAYLLTGAIKEHYWFFFVGGGRNGKSILMRVIEKLLGEYAKKISTDMLMKSGPKQQGSPSPEVLQLQGKRFVYANETTEGQRMDDAKIKDMTGGDTLTGRALHSNYFVSFDPTHKLVIAGNNYPIVQDDSHGFWARVVVFPFDVTFTEDQIDKDLESKLLDEMSGILNVLLEGMKDYLANGLQVPDALTRATQKYRTDQDTIQQFLDEVCETSIGYTVKKKYCYLAYQEWARANGLLPLSSRRFSAKLTKHGFNVMSDQRTWLGLRLAPPDDVKTADSQKDIPF